MSQPQPRKIRYEGNKNGLYYRKSMPAGKIIENSYKFNNVDWREFVYLCDCLLLYENAEKGSCRKRHRKLTTFIS